MRKLHRQATGFGLGFRVQGFTDQDLGYRAYDLLASGFGFRVYGSGFAV